jgi:hypothetical protein
MVTQSWQTPAGMGTVMCAVTSKGTTIHRPGIEETDDGIGFLASHYVGFPSLSLRVSLSSEIPLVTFFKRNIRVSSDQETDSDVRENTLGFLLVSSDQETFWISKET